MMLDAVLSRFDHLADAPDAVRKLRGLVVELAVTGRLVPRHESDSSAAALLESLRSERARLVDAKKIKARTTAPIGPGEPPFQIHSTWVWARLADVGHEFGQKAPLKRFTYIDVGAIDSDQGRISERIEQLEPSDAPSRARKIVSPGTVIYSTVRPYLLNVAIVEHDYDPEPIASTAFAILHPFSGVDSRYLFHWLRSGAFTSYVQACMKGMAYPAINDDKFFRGLVPLPPVAEQKRIVAKVDELMALCDQLEAQQQEREKRQVALAQAALARFADAPTPSNLTLLFHKSYDIEPADLRKSILMLAVQGKLVPQDPNEEPATKCLSRLGLESTWTSRIGSASKDETLPSTWTRVRFEDVAVVAGGVTLGRKLGEQKTVSLPYLRVANVKRGAIDLGVVKKVSIAEDELERYALKEHDLLMTEGGDWDKVGRAAIWRAEIPVCLHQNHVFRARMRHSDIAPSWFERYFNSSVGRAYFESASKQTTNLASINMRQVRGCPIPFPPLAEQRRIVMKVDELMALVDQLEIQLSESRTASAALLSAIVGESTTTSRGTARSEKSISTRALASTHN